MRIVIAPDKFKGSLDAAEVAAAVADGVRSALPGADLDLVPVADGGEGTVAAALGAGFRPVEATVTGPVGDPVRAAVAVDGSTAVVELAAASGLDLLPGAAAGTPRFAPLDAGTAGTGQLITAALDAGCTRIVLGVGGSATNDGGAGMLAALGARLTGAGGAPLPAGGGALAGIEAIDLSGLDPRLAGVEVVLAADVTNPLLGPDGAAAVFGPQKGASAADVSTLDAALARFARCVAAAVGRDPDELVSLPGAGAAGGVGFAALAVLRATRRPGIEVVRELVRLDERLAGTDVVITGEGSLDGQSLGGKSPVGVAAAARAHGVPTVIAVCGRNQLDAGQARAAGFDQVHALADREPDPRRSMAEAARLLTELGRELASEQGTGART
ncbi:glycerate kinase [Pseudonocardia sp. C8]|uniref:glycerate kinase n=1 Tax=Pseudonocardia sp. C8 TaxID=2762759 RepID=UPI00164285A0|nr:glycerate kinase [Pseudonocardia sp. C8]MBC3190618.1 glycerate kinase [Pseudonocardia sp. C8]